MASFTIKIYGDRIIYSQQEITKQITAFAHVLKSFLIKCGYVRLTVDVFCIPAKTQIARYWVTKSVMAFKKHGKESYNEVTKRTTWCITVDSASAINYETLVESLIKCLLPNSALETAGIINPRVEVAVGDSLKVTSFFDI